MDVPEEMKHWPDVTQSHAGVHVHTPAWLQAFGAEHVPQLSTVRGIPQLSYAVSGPHCRACRAQKAVSSSGWQA